MPFQPVNGARLYCEEHGAGEPLLLITGFTISAAVFEPVLDRYAERFRCIVYDNRGAGRTRAPRRPTAMPELAADAAGLLERLGVHSAHVYGLSMGGMVAQELALRFRERVRGLVLGGTTPGGALAPRPGPGGRRDPRGRPRRAGALAGAVLAGVPPRAARAGRELVGTSPRPAARPPRSARRRWPRRLHAVSRLGRLRAPTLVMHGECDALAPLANARVLAARIPDAELAIVPGAGHAYALERPETSYRLLTAWLDRRGAIAPGAPRRGVLARAEPLTRPFGAARPRRPDRRQPGRTGGGEDPEPKGECPCGD